jgi:hypothetical protein
VPRQLSLIHSPRHGFARAAIASRSADRPRDHTRLRKDDVQVMAAGADPIVPRVTQDSVIDKGPKTRLQVLGEPITSGGKQVRDFGYQLRQFDAMLRANALVTRVVVVDDALSDQAIRADLVDNLARSGDYVIVNYRRASRRPKGRWPHLPARRLRRWVRLVPGARRQSGRSGLGLDANHHASQRHAHFRYRGEPGYVLVDGP